MKTRKNPASKVLAMLMAVALIAGLMPGMVLTAWAISDPVTYSSTVNAADLQQNDVLAAGALVVTSSDQIFLKPNLQANGWGDENDVSDQDLDMGFEEKLQIQAYGNIRRGGSGEAYPYASGERVGAWKVVSVNFAEAAYTIVLTGQEDSEIPSHTNHDGIEFTPWLNAGSLPSDAGNYCLMMDVTLTNGLGTWEVGKDITLCLNGHSITSAGQSPGAVIAITNGATLTLYDCSTTERYCYLDGGGLGHVVAATDTNYVNAAADKKGIFTGGYITGGNDDQKGGIHVSSGSFVMHGGTIIGNIRGVNVHDGSTFTMDGGQIIGNTYDNLGGGVYVGAGSRFTMSGNSLIASNTGYVGGGVYIHNTGTFNLNGGSIIGNTAKFGGGGIDVDSGFYFDYGNGETDDKAPAILNVSGRVLVNGNTSGDMSKISNVNVGVATEGGPEYNAKITVGELDSNSWIGVTLGQGYSGVFTSGLTAENAEAYASCFFGDNGLDAVVETAEGASQNQLKLGKAPIYYTDHTVDTETGVVTATTKSCTNYTVLASDTESLLDGNWYVVKKDTELVNRLNVLGGGSVYLIICDGVTLTAPKGIMVNSRSSYFNIYAGSTSKVVKGTGTLIATGTGRPAGIGGNDVSEAEQDETYGGGAIRIHGGIVTATGDSTGGNGGAGIGGGYHGSGGAVTIYDGTVTAKSRGMASGIGHGDSSSDGGTTTIYGGTVYANGASGGSYGIGGSNYTLTIGAGMYLYAADTEKPEDNLSNYRAGAGQYSGSRYQYMTVNNVAPLTAITPTVSLDDWTYGQEAKTPTVTGNTGNGTVTYAYKLKTAEDSAYSAIVPTAAGEYTVRATIAATDTYASGTATADFTIAKANVTIKAKDQSIYVGGTVPTLGADSYTVTGLVGSDKLTTAPTLAYQKNGSAATPTSSTTGTYDIVPSGAEASGNYAISYENGTLTIGNRPSSGDGNNSGSNSGSSGGSSGSGRGSSGGSSSGSSSGSSGSSSGSSGGTVVVVPTNPTPEVHKFADVADDAWYTEAIYFMADRELMNGTDENDFSPDLTVTRGMLVTILYRLAGGNTMGLAAENSFTDVAPGSYYEAAIAWAHQQGIVGGYGDGLFGPDDAVTREQTVAMLYRYASLYGYDVVVAHGTAQDFNDYDAVSPYALDAAEWAVNRGILNGREDNTIDPLSGSTRAESATMLMRFIKDYGL